MSRLAALIDDIRLRGFNVRLIDGRIKIQGPTAPDTETEKMLDELRLHKEEVKSILTEDDPFLTPDQWYPYFRDFHHKVIAETADFDYGWLRISRLDLYECIKTKEKELDALGDARLSEVMAIVTEWRELVLKAEFERKGY